MKKVAILMGSDSDLPIVEKGINVLKEYGVPFEVHVYSAHRTPEQTGAYVKEAEARGIGVFICAAGMAAHLAGAVAANTVVPVIGIPVLKMIEFDFQAVSVKPVFLYKTQGIVPFGAQTYRREHLTVNLHITFRIIFFCRSRKKCIPVPDSDIQYMYITVIKQSS